MKLKKHQFITILLAVYAIFMTVYFGLDLLKEGQALRFWITLTAEITVIILAFFALRKRDYYRDRRKKEQSDF